MPRVSLSTHVALLLLFLYFSSANKGRFRKKMKKISSSPQALLQQELEGASADDNSVRISDSGQVPSKWPLWGKNFYTGENQFQLAGTAGKGQGLTGVFKLAAQNVDSR